jgi:hypothetical protein
VLAGGWGTTEEGPPTACAELRPAVVTRAPAEPPTRRATSHAPRRSSNHGGEVEERCPPAAMRPPSLELRATIAGVEGRYRYHRGAEHSIGEADQLAWEVGSAANRRAREVGVAASPRAREVGVATG